MTTAPVIFISYSHDREVNPEHKVRVLKLSERLRQDGLETHIDQYVNGTPPETWPRWMLNRIDEATFVLLVCTETYYRRFRGHEVLGKGKGADWEGAVITQEIYDAKSRTTKFVSVLFDPADEVYIPEPVRGHTHYLLTTESAYQNLYDFLLGQAGVDPHPVGKPERKTRTHVKSLDLAETEENVSVPPYSSDYPENMSDATSDICDPINQILNKLRHLADQELWRGVKLRDFTGIVPKVTLVETPFQDEFPGIPSDRFELNTFVSEFFLNNWRQPKWGRQEVPTDFKVPLILFITGDAGIGKTSSLKMLSSQWVNEGWLPLYAPLTEVLNVQDGTLNDDFGRKLDAYLQKTYNVTETALFYNDDNSFMKVLLILDGFDEAALGCGQSRMSILNRIFKYCDSRKLFYTKAGFLRDSKSKTKSKLQGIVIASRHRPTYAERQLLGGKTMVARLAEFEKDDVAAWLMTFNDRAKLTINKKSKDPYRCLSENDLFKKGGEFRDLSSVVTTPLYLYLLAATCAVSPTAASDIVGYLKDTPNHSGNSKLTRARFQILDHFVTSVENDDFLNVGAFDSDNRILETSPIPDRNARLSALLALGLLAGSSETREISFSQDIEGHKMKGLAKWAVRALPLERVEKKGKDEEKDIDTLWRFRHLSLVDFIVAKRLVTKLKEHAGDHTNTWSGEPAEWWTKQKPSVQRVTIEAGSMTMSDRAFEYVEQHLEMLEEKHIRQIIELAKAWSELNAVIVPKPKEMHEQDEYIVVARRADRGLRIANLGFPLLGCCLRAVGDNFTTGDGKEVNTTSRHRLRQYLRLASFVIDSEFASRSDVNRLPLTKLHSTKSSMEGVDMKDVILQEGELADSELQHAHLLDANLRGITISKDCNFQDSSLVGADLHGATLKSSLKLQGVSLYRATMSRTTMNGVIFAFCNMVNTNFESAKLRGATFDQCSMMGAVLRNAKLVGATLKKSILIGAFFSNADLSDATIEEGVWLDVDFEGVTVTERTWFIDPLGLSETNFIRLKEKGAKFLTRKEYEERNDRTHFGNKGKRLRKAISPVSNQALESE